MYRKKHVIYMHIYLFCKTVINRLPQRKTTGVVDRLGFHVFNIGIRCHINNFVLYIYIYIYIAQL